MMIVSSGPLRTGSTVWQTRSGTFVLTVVCKMTYWLEPGEAVIAAEQEAVNENDDHWDDDPNRSLRAPSDFMPTKLRPEVTLVGYAYAPNNQPVRSLVARMIVGDVDKSIEVHADRTFLADGTLHEGTRFTRMRLTWERAAGGPGTNNPVGMRADVRDAYGRRSVPNLQPIGIFVSTRDDFITPVGFGPIAATWPSRADLLGRTPPPAGQGLEGHTAAYYNAAPADQHLTTLRDNERIVLENLHPEHQRLVTSLPGYHPVIFVERAQGKAARATATADSLWIDTDRGVATLVWRALIPLVQKDEPGQVLVTLEPPGRELTWSDVLRIISDNGTNSEDDDDLVIDTITTTGSLIQAAAVLPFATRSESTPPAPPQEPPRVASSADLPFHPTATNTAWPKLQIPPAPTAPPAPKTPPVPASSVPSSPRASLPGTVVAPTVGAPPPPLPAVSAQVPQPPPPVRPSAASLSDANALSPDKPRAPASPWASGAAVNNAGSQPQTIGSQVVAANASFAVTPVVEAPKEMPEPPAKVVPGATPPAARANRVATSFDAAFGGVKPSSSAPPPVRANGVSSGESAFGVKAASDAAARAENADAPRERATRAEAVFDDLSASKRRHAVVNLLSFDAQIVPRLRRNKRLSSVLGAKKGARRVQGLDEPVKDAPSDDRGDVLRVLSCGQPADVAEIRRALAECLDDPDELEPPLLLVAGELRPIFDEIEQLRTTIAIAQQVAAGDKKVLAAITIGQEAVAAPIAPRPETTLGFVRQIETAAALLNLPQRYVPAEVERVLTEGRKYKRRTILGAPRVRADLTLRSGDVLAMYLPDSASNSLPLLNSFSIVAICEITPREDMTEAQDEALVALALGRVLRSR